MKKQLKYADIKSGDIFKVPFDPPYFTYARELTGAAMAFYDLKTDKEIKEPEEIIKLPILFILMGGADGILERKWDFIGNIQLEDALKRNPPFYSKKDYRESLEGPLLSFYRVFDNGSYRVGTPKEVEHMEYDFTWGSARIEERIRNHYNGIKFELLPVFKITEDEQIGYPTDPRIVG